MIKRKSSDISLISKRSDSKLFDIIRMFAGLVLRGRQVEQMPKVSRSEVIKSFEISVGSKKREK